MRNGRNWFVGILICAVGMGGLLRVGKAEARKGGLPQCLKELATCQTDLEACEAASTVGLLRVDKAEARKGGLPQCLKELATCQTDLEACEAASNVIFPGDGQEGTRLDYGLDHGPALSYTDNGDGTITDNNTQLVWEKKDTVAGSVHNVGNTYQWSRNNSGIAADGSLFTTFLATLNTAPCFAGHCDWRIPNIKELQSIVDYSQGRPGPMIASTFPGPTATTFHWSSTSYAVIPYGAWYVHFNFFGGVGNFDKINSVSARAVRGGL